MTRGIGFDMCEIARIQKIIDRQGLDSPFFQRTFSAAERAESELRSDKAAFFAARFASKEAVLKALAHLTFSGNLDLRAVETLHDAMGCPYVVMNELICSKMSEASVNDIHISVSTEAGIAAAFVVAEG